MDIISETVLTSCNHCVFSFQQTKVILIWTNIFAYDFAFSSYQSVALEIMQILSPCNKKILFQADNMKNILAD